MDNFDFEIENLRFFYPGEKVPALDQISFGIKPGEFVLITGRSGSGKTTLLRSLKPSLSFEGEYSGKRKLFGKEISALTAEDEAQKIGFVLQNPDFQAVTHTVRSELAFGLENLGYEPPIIRMRTAEAAAYFGLEDIFDTPLSSLSGGKLQLVCLASIIALHPKAILLDEPISQLDPMTCDSFIGALKRLSLENSITVIISEHRLEKVLPFADRIMVMEDGKLTYDARPCDLTQKVLEKNDFLRFAVPSSARIIGRLGMNPGSALTVRDAGRLLDASFRKEPEFRRIEHRKRSDGTSPAAVEMKNICFSYDESKRVLNGFNLKIGQNCFFALMGANAAGKTTALRLMSGIYRLNAGKIELFGRNIKKYSDKELYRGTVALLSQKVHMLFAGNTVEEDLRRVLDGEELPQEEKQKLFSQTVEFFDLEKLLGRHPYDISQGEMQRAAFCMALLRRPKLLLLDEPTKGMDALFKRELGEKIRNLVENGMTVVAVSHDNEFCAEYCDECAFICDGICSQPLPVGDFFSDNFFYSTEANKISRHIFENAVTEAEVLALCQKNQHCR